jgi:hypothetical protein
MCVYPLRKVRSDEQGLKISESLLLFKYLKRRNGFSEMNVDELLEGKDSAVGGEGFGLLCSIPWEEE